MTVDRTDEGHATGGLARRGFVGALLGSAGLGAIAATQFVNEAPAEATGTPFVKRTEGPVDVRDHGATGDGATDDSKAVQAAVDEAGASGRAVYFPAGSYVVTKPLRTTADLTMVGDGMWRSIVVSLSDAGVIDAATAPPRLEVEDLAFDSTGRDRSVIILDGHHVRDFVFDRCRFTNLAGDLPSAPAAIHLVAPGRGSFIDNLFHNPAAYAGSGTAVRVDSAFSGGRLVFRGNNRFLWLNNGIRSEPYVNAAAGHATLIESLELSGAYFDGFWWLLPAVKSGEGKAVSYTATTLTDSAADFSDIAAAARPNIRNVRAMPVRRSGKVGSASGSDLVDSEADFVQAGVLRGEIVRCGDRWAAVAEGPVDGASDRLFVEGWLDVKTLLPTAPPAAGASYDVFGVIIAAATSASGDTLQVENWRDRQGRDVLPPDGTRYEVLRARPTYLFFTGPGGVLDMSLLGCTFRRGWADLASVRSRGSRTIGSHFLDGQESGLVISNGYSGHHVHGNTFDRIGNTAIYVQGSQSTVIGNRITGGQTQRPISNGSDISIIGDENFVAFNVAETGPESQTPHPMISTRPGSASSTSSVFVHNRKFGELDEVEVLFLGKTNVDNEVVGSRRIDYASGAVGQVVETSGPGSPEGAVAAAVGSTYRRTDGSTGSTLYVKESGTSQTGWVAK